MRCSHLVVWGEQVRGLSVAHRKVDIARKRKPRKGHKSAVITLWQRQDGPLLPKVGSGVRTDDATHGPRWYEGLYYSQNEVSWGTAEQAPNQVWTAGKENEWPGFHCGWGQAWGRVSTRQPGPVSPELPKTTKEMVLCFLIGLSRCGATGEEEGVGGVGSDQHTFKMKLDLLLLLPSRGTP